MLEYDLSFKKIKINLNNKIYILNLNFSLIIVIP